MPSPVSDKRTQRLRRYWDKHARNYDRQMSFWEGRLFGDGRQWVCAQATGEVLEVAIGTGRNLPYYPDGIRLTGVDFSPQMLQHAQRRADQLGRQVDLRLGDAHALDFPDASFDTVVCTLSLCAIPDERRAVAEMKRVLRPGGRLLLLDHVAGASRWVRAVQWLLEQVTRPLGEEHLRRRPLLQVQAEGFQIEQRERTKLGIVERLTARKPAQPIPLNLAPRCHEAGRTHRPTAAWLRRRSLQARIARDERPTWPPARRPGYRIGCGSPPLGARLAAGQVASTSSSGAVSWAAPSSLVTRWSPRRSFARAAPHAGVGSSYTT